MSRKPPCIGSRNFNFRQFSSSIYKTSMKYSPIIHFIYLLQHSYLNWSFQLGLTLDFFRITRPNDFRFHFEFLFQPLILSRWKPRHFCLNPSDANFDLIKEIVVYLVLMRNFALVLRLSASRGLAKVSSMEQNNKLQRWFETTGHFSLSIKKTPFFFPQQKSVIFF